MRIGHGLRRPLSGTPAEAAWAEEAGFDAVTASEVAHDPFLPLALAAQATDRPLLQTQIAVAFSVAP